MIHWAIRRFLVASSPNLVRSGKGVTDISKTGIPVDLNRRSRFTRFRRTASIALPFKHSRQRIFPAEANAFTLFGSAASEVKEVEPDRFESFAERFRHESVNDRIEDRVREGEHVDGDAERADGIDFHDVWCRGEDFDNLERRPLNYEHDHDYEEHSQHLFPHANGHGKVTLRVHLEAFLQFGQLSAGFPIRDAHHCQRSYVEQEEARHSVTPEEADAAFFRSVKLKTDGVAGQAPLLAQVQVRNHDRDGRQPDPNDDLRLSLLEPVVTHRTTYGDEPLEANGGQRENRCGVEEIEERPL